MSGTLEPIVPETDQLLECSDVCKNRAQRGFYRRSWFVSHGKWALSVSGGLNILLAAAVLALFWNERNCRVGRYMPSFEAGYPTELESMKSEIVMTQHNFQSGILVDEHGKFLLTDKDTRYVGTPTAEINQAWHHLVNEAMFLEPADYDGPMAGTTGLGFTGVEVFHSLHCLNRIRQAFYKEYYPELLSPGPDHVPIIEHIDHCIDHIRQALQCHSDLTPMAWVIEGNKLLTDTTTQHTCRNFEKIHAAALARRKNMDSIEAITNGSLVVVF